MVFRTKLKNHKGEEVDGFLAVPEFEAETKIVSEEKRQIEFVISSQSQDRDGDVVDQKGLDTKYYDSNPVVLYSHLYGDKDIPALGLSVNGIRKELDRKVPRALSVIEFVEEGINKHVDMIYRMASHKPKPYIKMASIGFMTNSPEDVVRPGSAEERSAMNVGQWGVYFRKAEMLEWSVCPIGSNRDANRKGFLFQEPLEKGIIDSEGLEWIDKTLGSIWMKMGIVKRESGLLTITEEYLNYLTGKKEAPKPVEISIKTFDAEAMSEALKNNGAEIKELLKAFLPRKKDLSYDQLLLVAENIKKIQKKSPVDLTADQVAVLESIAQDLERSQEFEAPGRSVSADGSNKNLMSETRKGVDLYGNNPAGA